MRILLTEYEALRSEIQCRNQFQNRFIWFHIFALTSIIGIAISASLGTLFLIPIEAPIFGLWYSYQDTKIRTMGNYIRTSIERKACTLVADDEVMQWEKYMKILVDRNDPKWEGKYKFIYSITFLGPSIIALLVTVVALITYRDCFQHLFKIEWLCGLAMWIIGLCLTVSDLYVCLA